jgi:hypothetical protein
MKPGNKIWHYYLAAFALLLVLDSGCNPAKQVAKQAVQYQQLVDAYTASHPPRIDTNTVYISGKPDSIYIAVPVSNPLLIASIKDSLQAAIESQYDYLAADCSQQINDAFDVGYKQARDELKRQKIPAAKTDTIRITITPVDYINSLKNTINTQAADLKACQAKPNYWWPFIISLFINALLICLIFKFRS